MRDAGARGKVNRCQLSEALGNTATTLFALGNKAVAARPLRVAVLPSTLHT